jgi:hypothetical protein
MRGWRMTREPLPEQVDRLLDALRGLRADELPNADGLRASWHDLGVTWSLDWARAYGRDLRLAAESLDRAQELGPVDTGEAKIENALWRIDSAYEKLHDLIALGLGVPSLRLRKDRKGILRFESDRRRNRRKLREVNGPAGTDLLKLDEEVFNHRGLELRHQMTHSLAPIRQWRSLIWFEQAEVDERGGVVSYHGMNLTPASSLQGDTQPGRLLFEQCLRDARELVDLLLRGALLLAEVLRSTAVLPPPPVVYRVKATGEAFFDRHEAAEAARAAASRHAANSCDQEKRSS